MVPGMLNETCQIVSLTAKNIKCNISLKNNKLLTQQPNCLPIQVLLIQSSSALPRIISWIVFVLPNLKISVWDDYVLIIVMLYKNILLNISTIIYLIGSSRCSNFVNPLILRIVIHNKFFNKPIDELSSVSFGYIWS